MKDQQSETEPLVDGPRLGPWLMATTAVALTILLIQTVPFDFTMEHSGSILGLTYDSLGSLVIQAGLFIPLGITEGVLSRSIFGRHPTISLLMVLVDALLLSVVCETVQYFLRDRSSSVIDLTACAFGAIMGYVILCSVLDLRRGGGGG